MDLHKKGVLLLGTFSFLSGLTEMNLRLSLKDDCYNRWNTTACAVCDHLNTTRLISMVVAASCCRGFFIVQMIYGGFYTDKFTEITDSVRQWGETEVYL